MVTHCSPGVAASGRRGGDSHDAEFDPFREVDRLAQQVFGTTATARGPRWMPMDLYRVEDHFVIAVDLPGVDPGSIDVGVDGNTLMIRAERSVRSEEHAQWLAQERPPARSCDSSTLATDSTSNASRPPTTPGCSPW